MVNLIRSDILVHPTILDMLGNIKGKNILDIGCGKGQLTEKIAKKEAQVIGIDTDELKINNARGKKGTYIVGDAREVYFSDQLFDQVVCSMTALYLNDKELEKSFKRIESVLREKGIFILADIHPVTGTYNKESKYIKQKTKSKNYFLTEKLTSVINNIELKKEFQLEYYRRSFETYMNISKKAKFELEELVENKPCEELISKYKELKLFEKTHPSYITMKFRKK